MHRYQSPEAELVLLLAGTRRKRSSNATGIRRLAAETDSSRLKAEMARQRMVPLLGARLIEAAPGEIDPRFAEEVHVLTEAAARHGVAQELAMQHLAAALEHKDVRCLPVKGQALSRALYGRPGMRASSDIDLLVLPADLRRAVGVLEGEGFRAVNDRQATGPPHLHIVLVPPGGTGLPTVELHWRLHWYEESFAAQVLERSATDGPGVRRASPVDELASLLLFYARDGFVGLRYAADIATRLDATDAPVRAERLTDVMAEHPRLVPALRAASIVASRVVGTERPSFAGAPGARRREQLAMRLCDPYGRGDADQTAANVALVDLLLSPSRTFVSFAGRQLAAPDATTTAAAHSTKTLTRFAAALWALRGGRAYAF